MKKNKVNILISVLVVLALLLTTFAGCAQTASAAITEEEVESATVVKETSSTIAGHGTSQGKEETVYVIADCNGNPTKTIVSSWLKNPEERDVIEDVSMADNIENVKGYEEFTKEGDNITWQANGNDIYYQGDYEGQLPMDVTITYELNGREVTDPQVLAGASGHLKMTFSYENHMSRAQMINGTNATIYQPFIAVSGMVMDAAVASNVTVTNGKVINTGDELIIAGLAMPGLEESLGISGLGVDLPESVTVEADIENFSLLTTVTMFSNSFLDDVDLGYSGIDNMTSSLTQLFDASTQLVEGSQALNEGMVELQSGVTSLKTGTCALRNGTEELFDKTALLDEKVAELATGVDGLPQTVATLKNGVVSVKDVLKNSNGTSVFEATTGINQGALQMMNGLKSGDATNPGIYEAAQAIEAGAQQISTGLVSNDPSNPGIYEAAGLVKSGLGELPGKVQSAVQALTATNQYDDAAVAELTGILADDNLTEEQKAAITQAIASISTGQAYVDAVVSDLGNISLDQANAALDQIQQGAQTMAQGAVSGDPSNPGIYEGAVAIEEGANALYEGASQIYSLSGTVAAGINELVSGNGGNNIEAMVTGLTQLETGSQVIERGAALLSENTGILHEGVGTLDEGAKQLDEGVIELSEGVIKLVNGSYDLVEGMQTFDTEGMGKLKEILEGNIGGAMDRFNAVRDYAKEYNNFAGCGDMDCTVKFVIRTDSIGDF